MKERKHEEGSRQGDAPMRAASAALRQRASAANSPPVAPASSQGVRLPPDLRTAEEKAADDREEAEHWDRCRAEGYDAARDYAGPAKTESSRPRWRAILERLVFWR